ncbi:hypothetical protein Sjap_004939 [Stephania japonica]|uniref:PPPDE domain-containing protein n=1 Tax=Stephania japonica TaxID=461633 RepID=A0AAP0K327_9MAGN
MGFKKGFRWLKKVVFKTRGDLDNALAEAEEEVVNIATALGENTLSLFFKLEKRDGTPKDQLSSIKQTLKELQRKREERMKEFFDIQSQIIQVHEALRGSVVDGQIVDDKDLTTKRLRELKLVLQGLQSEKKISDNIKSIHEFSFIHLLKALVENLIMNVKAWKEENGIVFLYDKIPLLDSLQQDTFFWLEQEEENKRPRKRNPRFVPVNLNVYDLDPINGSIYCLGLGLYHSGIQVHGVEYEFGGHDTPSTGIFRGKLRECPGLTFRNSILIERTDLGPHEVHKFMEDLSKSYTGTSYNLITKNCNHFCNDERFYFGDHVLPCFETGIPLFKQRLHQLPDAENISIAVPDDGAWKRFYFSETYSLKSSIGIQDICY